MTRRRTHRFCDDEPHRRTDVPRRTRTSIVWPHILPRASTATVAAVARAEPDRRSGKQCDSTARATFHSPSTTSESDCGPRQTVPRRIGLRCFTRLNQLTLRFGGPKRQRGPTGRAPLHSAAATPVFAENDPTSFAISQCRYSSTGGFSATPSTTAAPASTDPTAPPTTSDSEERSPANKPATSETPITASCRSVRAGASSGSMVIISN